MSDQAPTMMEATDVLTVLHFAEDGTGAGLYTEVIDLYSLGKLEISRATWIEFDEEAQNWVVFDYSGQPLFSDKSRQVCLAWERRHFNDDTHEAGKEVAA